jgi:hypothetical protein
MNPPLGAAYFTAGRFIQSPGEFYMKKNKVFWVGASAFLVMSGLFLSGCATPGEPQKAAWSDHSVHSSKDYTVVGTIVIRTTDPKTVNADLMEKAVEMGGHDVINVRYDVENSGGSGQRKIVAVTAVAIKYTNDTLKSTRTEKDDKTTTTTESPITAGGGSSPGGGGERKKFLGIF